MKHDVICSSLLKEALLQALAWYGIPLGTTLKNLTPWHDKQTGRPGMVSHTRACPSKFRLTGPV